MEDIIIEEKVEKIVIEKPTSLSYQNSVFNTREFREKMSVFEYVIDGAEVVVTGLKYFDDKVEVPMGVTKIGKYAFSSKNFHSRDLETITLPKSVYEIEEGAFYRNDSIKSVYMHNSSVLKIGKDAFAKCSSLERVTFSSCLNEIGENAFNRGNSVENKMEVVIPNHTKFEKGTFDDNTTIELWRNSLSIKEKIETYYLNKIETIKKEYKNRKSNLEKTYKEQLKHFKEDIENQLNSKLEALNNEKKQLEQQPSKQTKVETKIKEANSVSNKEKIENVTPKESYDTEEILEFSREIKKLPENAQNIKKIILKDFKIIDGKHIGKLVNLESVVFVQYLVELKIADKCFYKNKKLKSVDFQSNNKQVEIGIGAFEKLKDLEYFNFNPVVSVGVNAFANCKKLKQIKSRTLKCISMCAFDGCDALEEIDLIDSRELHIYPLAFRFCTGLKRIVLYPDSKQIHIEDAFFKKYIDSLK